VQLAGGGGTEHDLIGGDGHAPVGEHDRHALAGDRVIGVALDRDLAGLGSADARVVDPGNGGVGGNGPEYLAGRAEVAPDNPRSAVSCQVWPNRAGFAAASETPAAKVKAASTPSTPAIAPSKAGRTGTADRPFPGSSANRAPTSTDTGSPAAAAAAATLDRRGTAFRRRVVGASAATAADPAATRAGARTQPGPRISQSALTPGCGSTYEAAPIGIHREATMAAATPRVAPAAAATAGGAAADATAWRGVMPTACRTWRSATAAEVYLDTDCPIRTIAASSAATANASRQAASYPVIR
jgi:hypothetical protein